MAINNPVLLVYFPAIVKHKILIFFYIILYPYIFLNFKHWTVDGVNNFIIEIISQYEQRPFIQVYYIPGPLYYIISLNVHLNSVRSGRIASHVTKETEAGLR